VLSGVGNWIIRVGIEEIDPADRIYLTPETFFAGSSVPTVVYLGLVEVSTSSSNRAVVFAYKRVSENAANLGVDGIFYFGAEDPVSITKINIPFVDAVSPQYVHVVQPELFNFQGSQSIIANGRSAALFSQNRTLDTDIPATPLRVLGSMAFKRENGARWYNETTNTNQLVSVVGTNNNRWVILNTSNTLWRPNITIGLIDVYPYLPRI
jgi:hypothetical protein